MKKAYEVMTITKLALGDAGAKKVVDQVKEAITSLKGEVTEEVSWGKRKFAYPINHDTEGYYDVLKFEMEGANIEKLKSKLNLMEDLVRYLITTIQE